MTPAARVAAAIEILDRILAGSPAEPALIGWARASRYAGSGDRAAVRDLVFGALRRRDSLAALGGGLSGRALMLGLIRAEGSDPDTVFSGEGHAPLPLSGTERAGGVTLSEAERISDLPDWLWPDWVASLGADALPLAHAMRERAPVWLRVNPRRGGVVEARAALSRDGVETEADDHPNALRVISGERRINGSAAYRDGLVELQDLSPQLACVALPLSKGALVLDYCAGGGGKSLALAAREDVQITAHDADPGRMADLPERARRAGVRVDLARPGQPGSGYDLVVADVPCSGSGTWRRSPDAKWRLDRAGLDALIATQAGILAEVAPVVRPGGHLAYMTCSLLEAENAGQIDRFLSVQPEYTETQRRFWTPINGSDGFFLSLLRRNGSD
ncbi:RsmB/NOP family class I SAM-dependent RNA methyltransferase [Paracoccus sp. SCSIO 75233]|uniref:RsmB/NOP family class I SAM-dependent RNA methyltransferase n=1 Tax=Paracoccus sp. SCSIO 75233 TaxID=3017782 RepID=UPI0022F0A04E|nr:RsmB/NOP family class I SAM-dependent RNA methyltransferase [Paracoccus sp. SCSIO 75233]WBU54728.1 RsmB/NOP family class I SAM-dependent RNA methyltransferase [Paracoccus sp. SCSIO 75233]